MEKKQTVKIVSGQNPAIELNGEEHAVAMGWNLLIMAALTRTCLLALSAQSPTGEQLYNLATPVMEELMRSALSETETLPILSTFDLTKTLNFTLAGSLKISSDRLGIASELVDVEIEIKSDDFRPNFDWDNFLKH